MDGDGNAKFGLRAVEKSGMAAGLMMNVKTASQERANHFLGFKDGKFFCLGEGMPYGTVTATCSRAGAMS